MYGIVNQSGTINIRSGAGTNYPVIGTLEQGQQIHIGGIDGSWYNIFFGENGGYVEGSAITTDPVYGTVTLQSGYLNVRSGAGTNCSIIGSLYNGQKVQLGGLNNGWYNIFFGENGGYVYAQYITFDANPTPVSIDHAVVIEDGMIDIRSGAGTNYPVIGTLAQGQQVHIGFLSGDWYNIYFGSNGGYINSKYVTTGPVYGTITLQSGYLNIRSGAGTNYSVIGTLNNGQTVQLGGLNDGWYNIFFGENGGYVDAQYITFDNGISLQEPSNGGSSSSTSIDANLLEQAAIMIALDEGFSSEPYDYGVGVYGHSAGYGTYEGEFDSFPISKDTAWSKLKQVLESNYIPYCDKFIQQYLGDNVTDCQRCAIYTFGYNLEGYVEDLVNRLSKYDNFDDTFGRFLIPSALYDRRMRSWETYHENKFNLFTCNYSVLPNQNIIDTAKEMQMNS